MSEKQPEALFHAEWLDRASMPDAWKAATELRRLHEVNVELLVALQMMVDAQGGNGSKTAAFRAAENAIAKATKGQQ